MDSYVARDGSMTAHRRRFGPRGGELVGRCRLDRTAAVGSSARVAVVDPGHRVVAPRGAIQRGVTGDQPYPAPINTGRTAG